MNKLIKPIKKELADKYGYKNVSVKNGTGTAWGWVEISITAKKPNDCFCLEGQPYCQNCKDLMNTRSREAEKLANEALKKEGLEFYTYCSDDGYNTDRNEVLISVNLI